jgi:hypothetical protein
VEDGRGERSPSPHSQLLVVLPRLALLDREQMWMNVSKGKAPPTPLTRNVAVWWCLAFVFLMIPSFVVIVIVVGISKFVYFFLCYVCSGWLFHV